MTLVKSFFSFVLQFSNLHKREYNYSLQRDTKPSKTALRKGKWCFQPVMGSLTHPLGLGLEGGQRLGPSTIWSPSDANEPLWWMVFWPWPFYCLIQPRIILRRWFWFLKKEKLRERQGLVRKSLLKGEIKDTVNGKITTWQIWIKVRGLWLAEGDALDN